jgi:hypothetical protein
MSLKAFHIVFVTLSTLLAFGFGAWAIVHYYQGDASRTDFILGIVSCVLGVALILYGKYVLRKLKGISCL